MLSTLDDLQVIDISCNWLENWKENCFEIFIQGVSKCYQLREIITAQDNIINLDLLMDRKKIIDTTLAKTTALNSLPGERNKARRPGSLLFLAAKYLVESEDIKTDLLTSDLRESIEACRKKLKALT